MKKLLLLLLLGALYTSTLVAQNVQVSTFAGSGITGSTDGTGTAASFRYPKSVCSDTSGNIYVADGANHKIRKITPAGVVSTFAGSGVRGSADGIGTSASFNEPNGLCIDAIGNIYVADRANHKIRKITPAGVVSTFAGSGVRGSADGIGTSASFYNPTGLCSDTLGNIYVADQFNDKIRKITPAGVVSTFAGSGSEGSTDGIGTSASFNLPLALCSDINNNIYVVDYQNLLIRKIIPSGVVSTFASGINAMGICTDALGNIYVGNRYSNIIIKITPTGLGATFAGSGVGGSVDGTGAAASFSEPAGLCSDAQGNIYVADGPIHKIRKIVVVPPAPPVVNYVNLPNNGSVCMGSTLNQTPTITGSAVQLRFNTDSINVGTVKSMSRGANGDVYVLYQGDSIVQYSITGTRIAAYSDFFINTIQAFAVAASGKVYVAANGSNPSAIYRFNANGSIDISFSTTANSYTSVTDMKIGKDGFLYVADNINATIDKIDTVSAMPNTYATAFDNASNVSSMWFGKNEMYIFKRSDQKVYARNLDASGSFTQVFQGLDTLNINIDQFQYDTVGTGTIIVSSKINNKIYQFLSNEYGFTFRLNSGEVDYTQIRPIQQPLAFVFTYTGPSAPQVIWAASSNNKLISLYAYWLTISPPLPAGLSFDPIKGRIIGTPLAPAPATTYTLTANSSVGGTTTHTINFSIDPPGPVSNAIGTGTSQNVQLNGLSINYFNNNNCEEIMNISNGNNVGNVQVQQQVLPTLASFASDTAFMRRVTEINAQNPNAPATVKLYYTFLDVQHFNQTNKPGDTDLINDTTGGTMQVGVLQLHRDSTGVLKQIKHNPIAAKWKLPSTTSAAKAWVVEFPITKFSTFYAGETGRIASFDCSSTGSSVTINSCGYYFWRGNVYTATGTYTDTTANMNGCDSVLTLNLTVTNDFEIFQTDDYLQCNSFNADSYQWINCDNGVTPISGATNYDYTATQNGSYAVIATKNSCTDTSLCVSVTNLPPIVTTINNENAVIHSVNFYPNPSGGIFKLNSTGNYQITVYTVLGEKIIEKIGEGNNNSLDLSDYPTGIYFAKIEYGNATKNIKLIKQ